MAKQTAKKANKAGSVSIRMYCIGTGDCLVLKFDQPAGKPFTMMIDCGSCVGDKPRFTEYITDLAAYVADGVDLLVVTHEHLDHVNGFAKCKDIFKDIKFKEAWFAWTEDPADPNGAAANIRKTTAEMKASLGKAVNAVKQRGPALNNEVKSEFFSSEIMAAHNAYTGGLQGLAEVNLGIDGEDDGATGGSLAGMVAIKAILKEQKTLIRYLYPGTTRTVDTLTGMRFHVLGPPTDRTYIYKDGKEGTDVYKKKFSMSESALAAKAFNNYPLQTTSMADLPFQRKYICQQQSPAMDKYREAGEAWRTIEDEWLMSAGALAIRLNSHINNTSLALAVERVDNGRVMLLPGDAEFGSWESWHLIPGWKTKGADGKKTFVEDLLNRTVFYKVGHHLSYNGTALQKGIAMMKSDDLVAIATLDRERISKGWKSTMPNKYLLAELTRKTGGRFFIMNEMEVTPAPSETLDPTTLGEDVFSMKLSSDGVTALYKQCVVNFGT